MKAKKYHHQKNSNKMAIVVLRVSQRAVRVQFDKQFHPDRLQSILNRNVLQLTNLKEKKRITQHQWNLLFPRTGMGYGYCCLGHSARKNKIYGD
jgi:hypothetical protein